MAVDEESPDAIQPPTKDGAPAVAGPVASEEPNDSPTEFPWAVASSLLALIISIASAVFSCQSVEQARRSADSSEESLEFASLDQRPWLKINYRIVKPLAFNIDGRASGQLVAMMTLEKTIENVGKGVATNIIGWEDVFPIDRDRSLRSALARREEWCGNNRHPDFSSLTGYVLFPGDKMSIKAVVGPTMTRVEKSVVPSGNLAGRAGFVVVGCTCYKATSESENAETHQTRFVYYLGVQGEEGGVNPYVIPKGIAEELQLVEFPMGFTAD